MHRQRQRGRKEQTCCDHVGRVVVKVQILVSDVAHPVEVRVDAVRKGIAPCAHQNRANHLQREVGKDREAEGNRHVIAHAELAADLDLTKRPRSEGAERADRDDLPKPALHQRRESQPIRQVGGSNTDLPDVPGRTHGGGPEDHRGAKQRKERRRDAKKAHIERANPEIEEISPDEGASANPVFSFETQHCHGWIP